ncbi:flagellar protein export ATPase FliI [Caminibacter mediatlanticus TB-2]|uniref:Flagellar protein export ATPase FliI n=1 Tax=Caminibacter mediatlanticus TB-2 TaxID=391592 RepID=A0ABX5VAQ5_9BACT|nr:flagellar protein export ATPase FliI [Caminibacter mediatlanticus]QCT93876.1 flagellar protein export ATPase FliI [Caminibacter mediatlanticus TB-2]
MLKEIKNKIKQKPLSKPYGFIKKINPTNIIATGLNPSVGDIVEIKSNIPTLGMVTSVMENEFIITPFSFVEGMKIGDKVYINEEGMTVPVGEGLLGRVVDPFLRPIDGKGEIKYETKYPIIRKPISPLQRGVINEVFPTGVKAIDGLLTCGKGQKLGIFAGSGVGKSTLMSMIVRGSESDIKVIALIGERGREIPEFIEHNLKGDLTNTVIIVATSDDSALMRKYGAFSAMAVAEYFKDKNKDVLFLMDSVTRFAMAQREIGLAMGEPPTSKGYPPSSIMLLPQLMERAGKEKNKGSITAFFTVLVEGDDTSADPIADQARSILDGHILLDRELTDFGIYPPINILKSASRVMNNIVTPEHLQKAQKFKKLYALLKENEVLIRIGAYQKGTDPELDEAIAKKEAMEEFLKQPPTALFKFFETITLLKSVI